MNLQIKLSELKRLVRSAERKSFDDWEETYINILPYGHTFVNGSGGGGGFFCQTLLFTLVEEGSGSYPRPCFKINPQDVLSDSQHSERQDLLLAQETGDRYKLDIIINPDYENLGITEHLIKQHPVTAKTKKQARQKARDIRNEYLQKVWDEYDKIEKRDHIPEYASEPVTYMVYFDDDLLFHINIKKLPEVIES